jgi:undecaprenyl-diphosphatase
VIALVLCGAYRRWGVFALTVIAIAIADWSSMGIKVLVDRPRPPLRYPEPKTLVPLPHDASFPSGHAATSFAAAVAFSRVYVGVHYPLDVIGGALLGALIAVALKLLAQRWLSRPTSRGTKAGD